MGLPNRLHTNSLLQTLHTTLLRANHKKLTKLLQKQAIQQLEHSTKAGFLSNVFLVPMGIHQDTETSPSPSFKRWTSGDLHRRHPDPCRVPRKKPSNSMVCLLEHLSFVVNKEKSVLDSTQTIEFLGPTINATNMKL